jgi:hypothetical protein
MKSSLSTALFVATLALIQAPAIAAPDRTPAVQLLKTATPGVKIYSLSSDPLVRSKQRASLGLPAVSPPRLGKPDAAGSLSKRICVDEDLGGGCSGAEEDFEMERFFMIEFMDEAGFRQRLDTVITYGRRCGVKVGNRVIGCADEPLFALDELMKAGWVKETGELIAQNIDWLVDAVAPLAPKCSKVLGKVITPDRDRTNAWSSAKDALFSAHAGNLQVLRIGTRFDVNYDSTGDTIRFVIKSFVDDAHGNPHNLEVLPMQGVSPAKNRCTGG